MLFNGIDLSPYFKINGIRGRGAVPNELTLVEVTGMDGAYLSDKKTPPRTIEIDVTIKASDPQSLRKKIDELNGILNVSEPVPIVFSDEPDRTYYGIPEASSENGEFTYFHQGTLTIVCPDPYKYGTEKEAIFPSDVVSLNYNGTAPGDPVFELEATQPITFAMIQNQNNEYMMIGKPIDVETQVPVQREERIFWSQADSLVGWTTAEKVDGAVAGSMESNGYLFQPIDYGTGSGWHGPAMKTSLPEVLTDFHVEAIVEIYNEDPRMIGRVEIYMLDEAGDIIGKIALKDINVGTNTTYGEARIGNGTVNYHLIDETGEYPWTWNNFYGILRIGRHDGEWFAYIAKIDQATGKHHSRMYREFNDVNNQFTKNLAQIAVHFGQMGTYTPANVRIQDIKVYKWNVITQSEVPYIVQTGDIITFDHVTKDVMINGESRKDLKDFGARFFKLQKGENQFVVLPSNSLAVRTRFQERFR